MKRIIKKVTFLMILGVVLLVLGLTVGLVSWVYWLSKDLPDPSQIDRYRPDLSSQILDSQGRVMAYLFDREHRLWVPLSEISENLQLAVIVAEDDTFFQHRGINYRETWNALKVDLEKKRYARGGSTITQQLAKNIFLSKEKTLTRKVKEYFLTREIEKRLSKKRILELYLNEVEWGDGIYGAEAASRTYFNKPASRLGIHEAALLAAMLPNPKYLNPYVRSERVKKRQDRILHLMYANKLLSDEELSEAQEAPLILHESTSYPLLLAAQGRFKANSLETCPMELLGKYLLQRYGDKKLYRGGMKIRTAMDMDLQNIFDLGLQESRGLLQPDLESQARPVSVSDPLVLIMQLQGTPRAMVCLEGEQTAHVLFGYLQSTRPPDAVYDYVLESAKNIPWGELIAAR